MANSNRRLAASLQDPERRRQASATGKIHTICFHIAPDIETGVMCWAIDRWTGFQFAVEAVEKLNYKPVPAGRPRLLDFQGHNFNPQFPFCHESLRKLGYGSVDCLGGPLDQHVLDFETTENKISSLHLLLDRVQERLPDMEEGMRNSTLRVLKVMKPVFAAISANDLSGEDITNVPKELLPRQDVAAQPAAPTPTEASILDAIVAGMTEVIQAQPAKRNGLKLDPNSATPHVKRHLREVMKGANIIYAREPAKALRLAMKCFDVIYVNLCMMEDVAEEDQLLAQELFMADSLIASAEGAFQEFYPEWDKARLDKETAEFTSAVGQSLLAREAHWHLAYEDIFRGLKLKSPATRTLKVRLQPQRPSKNGKQQKSKIITTAMLFSESTLGAAAMRRGNERPFRYVEPEELDTLGLSDELISEAKAELAKRAAGTSKKKGKVKVYLNSQRPYPDQPELKSATVVAQFYDDGHFVISSARKKKLHRVGSALRYLDLIRHGVKVTDEMKSRLELPGNFASQTRDGQKVVEWLFLPAYMEAFGNYFGANPFQHGTVLKPWEVYSLMNAVLETDHTVDPLEVVEWWLQQQNERRGDQGRNRRPRRDRGGRGRNVRQQQAE